MKKAWLLAIPIGALLILVFTNRPTPAAETPLKPEANEDEQSLPVEPSISIKPDAIEQGEPALISIEGIGSISEIESLTWRDEKLGLFVHDGRPSALVGIDLKLPPGSYPVILSLKDGRTLQKDLVVGKRFIAEAPLGIPDKLGGNTPEAEQALISNLAKENAVLASIPTEDIALWDGEFSLPVAEPAVITDPYGYTRLTGASTVSHKGTDFRAPLGTPVRALNSGVVRVAKRFTVYGNTVVIDHGLGLQTLYMHMSELNVKQGDMVEKGESLGKSGDTGYAESPHLHLSIKINSISIDPMKFIALFSD